METINSSEFHDYASLTCQLEKLQKEEPRLVNLFSLGQTPEQREIWCVRVTDPDGDIPIEHRPALLVTAHMHSVEFAGSCQALHFLQTLLQDQETLSEELRSQVLYVVPRVTPDGAEYALSTGRRIRSRYVESREKNVPFPEDLTKDGRIREMRWKSDTGKFRLSAHDPRILVPRQSGDEGPYYAVATEGLIHDWDGGEVGRSKMYCDFNRNFPSENWRGRPDWIGHGRYPLSEPETRALADFVLAHPQISRAVDMHTGWPAIFPPYTAWLKAGWEQDRALLKEIGGLAEQMTGWKMVTSYEELRSGNVAATEIYGGLKDWLYDSMGIPAMVFELGMLYNYCGADSMEGVEDAVYHEEWSRFLMEAHDANPEMGIFQEWVPYDHPQLGPVEIGGWGHVVQWSNPPLRSGKMPLRGSMQEVCERGSRYLLELLKWKPELQINVEVERIEEGLYMLKAELVNSGSMSTSVTDMGKKTHPYLLPIVELNGEGSVICGSAKQEIAHLEAHGGCVRVKWVVRANAGARWKIQLTAPRGGFRSRTVCLE